MKKNILMAAVGAALIAGPVVAVQAAPTVYGQFHLSFDNYDAGTTEHGQLSNNSSRFGVKGSEDLGGGLKALYQLETGTVAIDEGSGGVGGTLRNSFLGMAGGFGTVKVGRHDTVYKSLGRKIDNFNEEIGDMRSFIGAQGGLDNRVSNVIVYESPDFAGGWSVDASHTSNNASDTIGNTSTTDNAIVLGWSAGPLYVGFGYNVVGVIGPDDLEGKRLVGSYSMGNWKFGALYEKIELGSLDVDYFGLSAYLKSGNNGFKAHVVQAGKDSDIPDTEATLWAIGVDHFFSKTVKAYVDYATADNDPAADYGITSAASGHSSLPAPTGIKTKGYSAGLIMKF